MLGGAESTDTPLSLRDGSQGPGNCVAPRASSSAPGMGKGKWSIPHEVQTYEASYVINDRPKTWASYP